jgi:hypothetical protein
MTCEQSCPEKDRRLFVFRRMHYERAVIVAAMVFACVAASRGDDKPAPEGCHWQDLPEVKMHLAVPNGWLFTRLKSDGPLIFEVVPAGADWPKPSKSRYRLEIQLRTDKASVVERAREFVERAQAGAVAVEPVAEQTIGVIKAYSSFVRYSPAIQGVPAIATALSATANTRTGTLYTVRFDISSDEQERIAALGNALFRTARLDDEI